jgi:peptidoglycan hydrolase-like protein with peptidoglycan-binding domain
MSVTIRRITRHIGSALLGAVLSLLVAGCAHHGDVVPPPPQTNEDPQIVVADQIAKAQGLLGALGYDAGPADGVLGPRSIAAIRSFQKDRHIAETGKLTRSLLTQLVAARAKLPKDTLLRYETGEVLIYSDGSSEEVTDAGEITRLASNSGGQILRRENFLNLAGDGERSDAPDDFLQPLRPGAKGDYQLLGNGSDGKPENPSTVSCAVGPARLRNVPAGKFRAINVACTRTKAGSPTVIREWDYAPALHQAVREVVKSGGKIVTVRELVAIRPPTAAWPAAARTGFDWAVVNGLNNADKGSTPVAWTSSGVSDSFSIRIDPTPVKLSARLPGVSGTETCLRYRLTRTDPEGEGRIYPGLACQSGNRQWRIPARQSFAFEAPPKGLE